MTAPGANDEQTRGRQVVVVGPDGQPVGSLPMADGGAGDGGENIGELVEQPAKVMRIGTMIKQLLEEVRAAPLDEASRNRLRDIHAASIRELEDGLSVELREELERITLPFTADETPSDAELRIAQQMAARAQLDEMRRKALPGGSQPGGSQQQPGGGQYL